jgi:hypothetical protein
MNVKPILLPAVAATSLMTISSYIVSHIASKNFSEPELLGRIEKRLLQVSKKAALPAGWLTHYSVGVALTCMYSILRNKNINNSSTLKNGLAFGALSGISAIIAWKLALKLLPKRADGFYNKYYAQLFLVHFVFAFGVVMTQKALRKKRALTYR